MRNQSILTLFLAFCLVIGMNSCTQVKSPTIEGVEIVELSRNAGDGMLRVNLDVDNPNSSSLRLKSAAIEASLNQKKLGKYSLKERIEIEGGQVTKVGLSYPFVPDDIFRGFLSNQFGALSSKSVRITLEGKVVFVQEDKEFEVPVIYSEIHKTDD